jgi:hypothetical protein
MSSEDKQLELTIEGNANTVAFFAYPSQPYLQSEAIRTAAAEINKTRLVKVRTWEEMSVTGKNIMQEICGEIGRSQVFCADITGLNPNVMFELGYAIARNKRIWLVFDTSFTELRKHFDQLQLLTTTGYAAYRSSDDIIKAFLRDRPYLDLESTVLRQSIEPTLSHSEGDLLLYLKSYFDTNASNRISKRLNDSEIPVIVDDPRESGVQALSWYGEKIYSSVALVAHLLSPAREGSKITNAKYAFVSGLAYGFRKPLLILAEPDYVSPIDYRDLLYNYKTANEALRYLQQWLAPIEKDYRDKELERDQYTGTLRLKVELRDFYVQIGEYLAENEASQLENYYIETTAYREALAGTRRLFVGRKGTGKTANLVALSAELRKNRNDIVSILQPVGYEIESLVKLFNLYREHDTKGYVIESLWKFLLLTEIANATVAHIEEQPPWVDRSDDEKRLLGLVDQDRSVLSGDFSIRLERCISALLSSDQGKTVEQRRTGISEALHETTVKTLRATLGDVLSKKDRVAILIDNLDKAWIKQTDVDQLSEFLLGLFSAVNHLLSDFARKDSRRKAVNCTAAIFVRSDIFNKVIEIADEPDKLAVTKLIWDDPEILSRVVEMRFLAAHSEAGNGDELWSKYFAPTVKGVKTRDYIVSRILPRPRDIVYLVKGAISMAVNRGHNLIDEVDVLSAEYEYSRYAIDSIMVENSITLPQLENVLYEFAGARVIVTESDVTSLLLKAAIPAEKHSAVIEHLIQLNFLGMEVGQNQYVYSDEPRAHKKHLVLSNKLVEQHGVRRYQIHPAFRAYLEVAEN